MRAITYQSDPFGLANHNLAKRDKRKRAKHEDFPQENVEPARPLLETIYPLIYTFPYPDHEVEGYAEGMENWLEEVVVHWQQSQRHRYESQKANQHQNVAAIALLESDDSMAVDAESGSVALPLERDKGLWGGVACAEWWGPWDKTSFLERHM